MAGQPRPAVVQQGDRARDERRRERGAAAANEAAQAVGKQDQFAGRDHEAVHQQIAAYVAVHQASFARGVRDGRDARGDVDRADNDQVRIVVEVPLDIVGLDGPGIAGGEHEYPVLGRRGDLRIGKDVAPILMERRSCHAERHVDDACIVVGEREDAFAHRVPRRGIGSVERVEGNDRGVGGDAHHADPVVGGNHQAGDADAVAIDEAAIARRPADVVGNVGLAGGGRVEQADDAVGTRALLLGDRRSPVDHSHPVIDPVGVGIAHQAIIPVEEEPVALRLRELLQGRRIARIDAVAGEQRRQEGLVEALARLVLDLAAPQRLGLGDHAVEAGAELTDIGLVRP